MKLLNKLTSILLTITLVACSSPLSDVEITDPSLINTFITLTHEDTEQGISSDIAVCLTDKNMAYIELKVGDVNMKNENVPFTNGCCRMNQSIKANTNYDFSISLADSVEYLQSISTPSFFGNDQS